LQKKIEPTSGPARNYDSLHLRHVSDVPLSLILLGGVPAQGSIAVRFDAALLAKAMVLRCSARCHAAGLDGSG